MKEKKLLKRGIVFIIIGFACGIFILNSNMNAKKQIRIFADQVEEWSKIYISSPYPFYITVGDLNQDGVLELITATIEGTGKYSQNSFFIIDNRTYKPIQLQKDKEGKLNTPDIIYNVMYGEKDIEKVPVYYDSKNNIYYSVYTDYCTVTPKESTESVVGMTIDNNKIKEHYLAYKLYEHNSGGQDDVIISYWDYSHNELSEKDYNKIEQCTYPDFHKMEMTWKWYKITGNQLINMDQEEIYKLLIELYSHFDIADVK